MTLAASDGGFVSQGAYQRSVECSGGRPAGASDQARLGLEGRKLADGKEARIACCDTDSSKTKHYTETDF
jgi:hypothetical protein